MSTHKKTKASHSKDSHKTTNTHSHAKASGSYSTSHASQSKAHTHKHTKAKNSSHHTVHKASAKANLHTSSAASHKHTTHKPTVSHSKHGSKAHSTHSHTTHKHTKHMKTVKKHADAAAVSSSSQKKAESDIFHPKNFFNVVLTYGIVFVLAFSLSLIGYQTFRTDNDDSGSSTSKKASASTIYDGTLISEIGWKGTSASVEDEFLELYNNSNTPINLEGLRIANLGTNAEPDVILGNATTPTAQLPANQLITWDSSQYDSLSGLTEDTFNDGGKYFTLTSSGAYSQDIGGQNVSVSKASYDTLVKADKDNNVLGQWDFGTLPEVVNNAQVKQFSINKVVPASSTEVYIVANARNTKFSAAPYGLYAAKVDTTNPTMQLGQAIKWFYKAESSDGENTGKAQSLDAVYDSANDTLHISGTTQGELTFAPGQSVASNTTPGKEGDHDAWLLALDGSNGQYERHYYFNSNEGAYEYDSISDLEIYDGFLYLNAGLNNNTAYGSYNVSSGFIAKINPNDYANPVWLVTSDYWDIVLDNNKLYALHGDGLARMNPDDGSIELSISPADNNLSTLKAKNDKVYVIYSRNYSASDPVIQGTPVEYGGLYRSSSHVLSLDSDFNLVGQNKISDDQSQKSYIYDYIPTDYGFSVSGWMYAGPYEIYHNNDTANPLLPGGLNAGNGGGFLVEVKDATQTPPVATPPATPQGEVACTGGYIIPAKGFYLISKQDNINANSLLNTVPDCIVPTMDIADTGELLQLTTTGNSIEVVDQVDGS